MVMTASSRPHDIVGPFLSNNLQCFVVDMLRGCGQRDCVAHQIRSPLLPVCKFGVAARSLGRDHALWRIDLYTAGTPRPPTPIGIHVSREPERCDGDQTTTGSHRTINLAGRRPPHRVRGKQNLVFLTLYRCTLRHQAILKKSPKCNRQPSRKPDNANLPAAHSRTGEALTPPGRQRAFRLVAQPGPRQLDESLPGQFRAGFADTAISTDVATRVWARRQADERCQMSSALEATVINLGNQQHGGYRADTAECCQALRFRFFRERTLRLDHRHLAVHFCLADQFLDQRVLAEQSTDFAPQKWREGPSIPGALFVDTRHPSPADPLPWHHDSVKRAQAFDSAHQSGAFVDKALASPTKPLRVFFFNA